jgi:ParB family chromosome partitioning protein
MARALAGLSDNALIEQLAAECVKNEYSVRALEERIKHLNDKKKPAEKKAKPALSSDLAGIEEAFRESLGTKVTLSGSSTRGKITIEYFNREDLERVYERIYGKE